MKLLSRNQAKIVVRLSTCTEGSASISRRFRWASLAKSALGVGVAVGGLAAGQAQAVVVNVDGQDYDVTKFTGSYIYNTSNFAPLPSPGVMPWWGDSAKAIAFANAVGVSLPCENSFGNCPFFGYQAFQYALDVVFYSTQTGAVRVGAAANRSSDSSVNLYDWAQASLYQAPPQPSLPNNSTVPGPLPLLGAAAAFGYSRKLRKRITSKA